MITPDSFIENWDKSKYGLVSFEEECISSFALSPQTKGFLTIAGLPESAPPFLTFEPPAEGGAMKLTLPLLIKGVFGGMRCITIKKI